MEGIGVPQLERLLAPIPDRSTVLFVNEPGIEAEPFLYQAAHDRLAKGGSVVYLVTNRAPQTVLAAMTAFGLDIYAHQDRLHFIDGFSALMGIASPAPIVVSDPSDPARVAAAVESAADRYPGAWLVVDSLSSVIDQSSQERFTSAFPRILAAMRRFELTEALFTRWPYGEDVWRQLEGFDATIGVRGVVDRVTTGQFFVVDRARWLQQVRPTPRPYKLLRPGGVHVYIPKIVVTGPYNAGKSSFVHSISDTAVSVDHLGTTVALDHGRVTVDGLTADIFGTAGQARFDPILKVVAGQAVGIIVVVDSTKPDSFARAREMLHQTWRQGLPGIIAANKQDLPDALPPDEVARLIQPPPRVKVVGCTGQDRDSGRRVLRELIEQILAGEAGEAA